MEPAATTAGVESQPGVLPTATEPHPRPSDPVGESPKAYSPSFEGTGTARPRRGDKTPASFAEYAVIKPARGRHLKKRVAEVQPAQELQQQELELEHDDLSTALAIPGFPALPDLGAAVREFMLGDGPKLSAEDIKGLSDQTLLNLLAKIPAAFLVNLDADPQQLVDANLLDSGVYLQYKDLTLPLHRYLVDRVCAEWFGKLRFSTKTNYVNAINRVTGAHQPLATTALVLPYEGIANSIDKILQSGVDAGTVKHPSGTLSVFQSALTRLVAIQLGVPAEQRPIADATKKFKNDTLLAIENKCTNGGSAWKLLVEKWRGYAHPNKRVAAVQKKTPTASVWAPLSTGALVSDYVRGNSSRRTSAVTKVEGECLRRVRMMIK